MQARQFLSQITDTGDDSGVLLSTHRKRHNKPPRRAARQHTWEAFLILGHSLLCRWRNLRQEIIQDIQVSLKIKSRLLIVKPPTGLALVEHIKSLLQRNTQSFRNLHHNTSDALPSDYVADFSVLLRRKMIQVLHGILIKTHISYFHLSLRIIF